MDYVRQSEHLDSRHFGVLPVSGHASRPTVNGKSRLTDYGAWCKRMRQWGKPAVLRSQLGMDKPFLRDSDKRTYVNKPETFFCNHTDWNRRLTGVLSE